MASEHTVRGRSALPNGCGPACRSESSEVGGCFKRGTRAPRTSVTVIPATLQAPSNPRTVEELWVPACVFQDVGGHFLAARL